MTTPPSDSNLAALRTSLGKLQALSNDSWASATPLFSYQKFSSGECIINAEQPVSDLYFLTSGLARFYYLHPEGKEFNKSFASAGNVVSSITSLTTGQASAFYVQALATSECLCLSYKSLLLLADQHKDWNTLTLRLLEQLSIKKEAREADFLLLTATERYEKFLRESASIVDLIPNYHIASYLGISEVALSRIRNRLRLT